MFNLDKAIAMHIENAINVLKRCKKLPKYEREYQYGKIAGLGLIAGVHQMNGNRIPFTTVALRKYYKFLESK